MVVCSVFVTAVREGSEFLGFVCDTRALQVPGTARGWMCVLLLYLVLCRCWTKLVRHCCVIELSEVCMDPSGLCWCSRRACGHLPLISLM